MNLLIFCAILSLSSSLAFRVTFHTVDLKKFIYQSVPVLVCTPHEFKYHRGDTFTMYLQLTNQSSKAVAVVKNESGDTYLTRTFWPEGRPIHFHPKFDKITIDVELSDDDTCVRQRILKGTEVSTTGTNITAFKYNDICLKEEHCLVKVDPARECTDKKLMPLPCEDGRYVEVVTPADDQRSKPVKRNNPETKNNPKTSMAKGDTKGGAENTYFIVMVVTSIISAVALILLLVIAIRQRCWIKYNPPGIPQILPTNENRFYENVLFRNECQQEIEELEQRVYDVVPAENEYMEINNRSNAALSD